LDVLIEMSYYRFDGFMTLAKNYLGVDAHPLFYNMKELMRAVEITPADVTKCLMMCEHTTLSGLLNFIDGLWSAHGGKQITIVFTTNLLDMLDPAVIRQGQMDVHIEMRSFCFEAFHNAGQELPRCEGTPADYHR
ncbi:hypothetical protein BAE44_0011438, partial [Dichanthelium oligosanthes]